MPDIKDEYIALDEEGQADDDGGPFCLIVD